MKLSKLMTAMALAGLTCSGAAMATDGLFSAGYGMTASGMGGAATAMSEDTFGGANNPASMAFVGNRIDLGASLFSPERQSSIAGAGPYSGQQNSDANYFVIPEFGYNHMVNNDLALGVSVYGNGGMNTDYAPNGTISRGISGGTSGNTGINLEQLIIAPTLSYKINNTNSIGIAPLLAYQQFSAQGLQNFAGFSSNANALSNNGTSSATGAGVRVGYMWKIDPTVTLGADYASKITMSKFSNYSGLFANQGEIDIPANYSLGVAWQATKQLKLALDYEYIDYAGVAAIGNAPPTGPGSLGATNGGGFGWNSISVLKLGAEYQYNDQWILRAGWNHCQNPIPAGLTNATFFNTVAPGVITDHITLGATYVLPSGNEWTMAYVHAFYNSETGSAAGAGFGASSTATIGMYQDTLGVEYSWK